MRSLDSPVHPLRKLEISSSSGLVCWMWQTWPRELWTFSMPASIQARISQWIGKGIGSVHFDLQNLKHINDKRRGSFDCTLQTAEAERVMRSSTQIPGYDSLANLLLSYRLGRRTRCSPTIGRRTTSQGMMPAWALMQMPSQGRVVGSPWGGGS